VFDCDLCWHTLSVRAPRKLLAPRDGVSVLLYELSKLRFAEAVRRYQQAVVAVEMQHWEVRRPEVKETRRLLWPVAFR